MLGTLGPSGTVLVPLLILFSCSELFSAAPVPTTNAPPGPKTLFDYEKEMAKKKPAWKMTTKYGEWKGKGRVSGDNLPEGKELRIRATWIVLEADVIELDKSNLSGGYFFDSGGGKKRLRFDVSREKDGIHHEVFPGSTMNHHVWPQKARVSTKDGGSGQTVKLSKIVDGMRYRLVPVQQRIELDDGTKTVVYYGFEGIATFEMLK